MNDAFGLCIVLHTILNSQIDNVIFYAKYDINIDQKLSSYYTKVLIFVLPTTVGNIVYSCQPYCR